MYIVRNVSGAQIELEDFGIYLLHLEERDLSEDFPLTEISNSESLKQQILNGEIIVNDGTQDLPPETAVDQVTVQTKAEDEADDPAAAGGWSIGPIPPATDKMGEGWFNTSDQMLYAYDNVRNLWLSPRWCINWGISGNANNKYLQPGVHNDPDGHILMSRDVVLLGAQCKVFYAKSDVSAGVSPEIDYVNQGDFVFPSGGKNTWQVVNSLNETIPIDAGESLQCYCWSNKTVKNAFVTFEMAWRIDP